MLIRNIFSNIVVYMLKAEDDFGKKFSTYSKRVKRKTSGQLSFIFEHECNCIIFPPSDKLRVFLETHYLSQKSYCIFNFERKQLKVLNKVFKYF